MPDVIEQLRSYGDAVEQEVEPAVWAVPRNRRPLLLAAAVFVVLAAAASAVWILQRGGDDAQPPVVSTVPMPDPAGPVGWQTLDPGPLAAREGSAVVWTGEELVVWGGPREQSNPDGFDDGAAYDPSTGEWRAMSPAPLRGGYAVGVWTGDEVLLWSIGVDDGSDGWPGAAWNPTTDTWRRLARGPDRGFSGTAGPVWADDEMVYPDLGAAYDPVADRWRDLPAPPVGGSMDSAVWTGDQVVVLMANRSDPNYPPGESVAVAYDPGSDDWELLPPVGVSENGADLTWDGHELVAVDYQMQASTWTPGDDRWRPLPPLPLRFYECSPTVTRIGDTVLVSHCSGYAILTPDRTWAIGPPPGHPAPLLVTAGDRLFSWWSTDDDANFGDDATTYLQTYLAPAFDGLAAEATIPVGTVLLDLPEGRTLEATDRFEDEAQARLTFTFDAGCAMTSTYDGSPVARIRDLTAGTSAVLDTMRLEVDLGHWTATVARVPAGEIDADAHILVEETTSDFVDISCPTIEQAEDLLDGIHR